MKKTIKMIIGLVLAFALVIGCGAAFGNDSRLKATDGTEIPEDIPAPVEPVPTEVVVEQNEEYVVSEIVEAVPEEPVEEAAPADEPAPVEEAAPTEGIAEEEAFDVVKAYEHYLTLSDTEKEEYLKSLTPENREALEKYIEKMENAEAEETEAEEAAPAELEEAAEPAEEIREPQTIELDISYTLGQVNAEKTAMPCTWKADISGLDIPEGTPFVWEESTDGGNTWKVIAGETGIEYTFILTAANNGNLWRCTVTY